MSNEAMNLALEALKQIDEAMPFPVAKLAQAALREALAKPDFWEGYVPEPVKPAQQEPDWLNKEQTETDWDHVWLLIKAASYASSKGFVSGTTNWGSAVSRYMRNESPQLAQQEPVTPKCEAIIEVFGHDWRLEYLSLPVGKHKPYTQQYTYIAPPPQRKPLTDAQINAFFEGMEPNKGFWLSFARAIEAAHGIKENT